MCGLAGIVDYRAAATVDGAVVERMCSLLAHRGPDHQGVRVWGGCGLGHRRLAITDLVTGQQPLANEDGTVWVVFNGEIYNYRALRRRLEALGHRFATNTDTEVIPHLYEEHGDGFVSYLEGNWAIGLWDEPRRRLVLTRDRLGKKPLAWSLANGVVRFASEAKALFADPALPREPDPHGLLDTVTFGFVTGPRTAFRGVSTVEPATTLVFENGGLVSSRRYWDVADTQPYDGTAEDALEELTDLLSEVTRERLMGDVPYGLMLSGGVDSPLVGSFMIEHEPGLATFTVSRDDAEDETATATRIARHLGSSHHVVPVENADLPLLVARIPWMLDQPFFNDATIANFQVARAVSGELTVLITGDGGDESFSGTIRHLGDAVARAASRAPDSLLVAARHALGAASTLAGDRTGLRRLRGLAEASLLDDRTRWLFLDRINLPGRHGQLVLPLLSSRNGYDPEAEPLASYDRCTSVDHLNRLLYAELVFQLPSNDLLKVDRAFMYNSVAGRSPFLDRRVVEFAASLPARWKQRGLTFKWLLRELARHRLPAGCERGRKVGLAVPFRDWLRGPLGVRVARLLASDSFASRGIFDRAAALRALELHRRGRADHGYSLWTMAMTELWFRSMIDEFAVPDERIWD